MDLNFVSNLPEIGSRPEIDEFPGGHFSGALPKLLSTEKVKSQLRKVIVEMTKYLNSMDESDGPFTLDEAEMVFQIDQSGKINIFVADVGGKISGGLKFKWKKMNK
ncbi:MAG: hypothetical protein GXO79_08665 [Chlorobi bacterium]|nr:hypothetical protein [Chlorobiota bacterium]